MKKKQKEICYKKVIENFTRIVRYFPKRRLGASTELLANTGICDVRSLLLTRKMYFNGAYTLERLCAKKKQYTGILRNFVGMRIVCVTFFLLYSLDKDF